LPEAQEARAVQIDFRLSPAQSAPEGPLIETVAGKTGASITQAQHRAAPKASS